MPLNSVGLDCDDFDQSVESDVSDVVVPVRQKLAEDVHTKHAEAGISLDVENGKHSLIEDGVSNVF